MKINPRRPRLFTVLVAALSLVAVVLPSASAGEAEAKAAAVEAMQGWLQGIDAGNYAESWTVAAASFQTALSSARWVAALESVRKPLGTCASRTLASALNQSGIPKPDGTRLPGDFVIAQFDTSFANLKYAVETVTFEREGAVWKASGYFIKPK